MYIGFAAFGFFGMLIAPVAVSCVLKITKNNRENNTEIRD
jgi:predicted PurR-regulated permease PerM